MGWARVLESCMQRLGLKSGGPVHGLGRMCDVKAVSGALAEARTGARGSIASYEVTVGAGTKGAEGGGGGHVPEPATRVGGVGCMPAGEQEPPLDFFEECADCA